MADGFTRIMVVDNNDEIRCIVSKLLSRMGYKALSTDSGDRGFNLYMNNRFDFLVTDIDMPGMDGPWHFTSKRSLHTHLPYS